MKFRKKPVVIEAILWDGKDLPLDKAPQWIIDAVMKTPGDTGNLFRSGNDLLIYTLEGTMKAIPGDWIIRGINGELYPCKPDIFDKTYQPADEPASTELQQLKLHVDYWQKETNAYKEGCHNRDYQVEQMQSTIQQAQERIKELEEALNLDKTGLGAGLARVNEIVDGYRWVTEGRGPYAWNDDEYRKEMLYMLESISKAATLALQKSGDLAKKTLQSKP